MKSVISRFFDRRNGSWETNKLFSDVSRNTGAKAMNGKIFVWLLTTVFLLTASHSYAQQPKKVPRTRPRRFPSL